MTLPTPALLKAISEADWERLLPRLAAYADHRLRLAGWARGRDREPSRMSVMEVIDEAVNRCLDGRRQWNDDQPPELGAFLCGVIKSIVSDERKQFVREDTEPAGDAIDEVADPDAASGMRSASEEELSTVCAAVEACVQGDDDLEYLRLAILEGNTKRDDIAAALGWSPELVSAARLKLQRRLLKRFPGEFAAVKKKRRVS